MESTNSASCEAQTPINTDSSLKKEQSKQWLSEQFEEIIPKIQENQKQNKKKR